MAIHRFRCCASPLSSPPWTIIWKVVHSALAMNGESRTSVVFCRQWSLSAQWQLSVLHTRCLMFHLTAQGRLPTFYILQCLTTPLVSPLSWWRRVRLNSFLLSSSMYIDIFFHVVDYKREQATAEGSTGGQSSTPKRAIRKGLFASASPAYSSSISSSAGTRKASLRPLDTSGFFCFFLW